MQIITLLIIKIILLHQTFGEDIAKFICEDGNTINLLRTCDGKEDCPDGSDEIKKLCYRRICSGNKFRCHYGACVQKESRCDGIVHCADGSDENQCGKKIGNCRIQEFKCLSGECISNKLMCDGKEDCEDGSDEEPNTCEKVTCPMDSYRCKVGGCVRLNQTCNGYQDCIDGSDESEILCKNLDCTSGKGCNKVQDVYCPPITSTRITVTCKLDSGRKKGIVPCGKPLPVGTQAHYKCKPYYVPATSRDVNNRKMVCQADGTWNRDCLKCKPDCGTAELDAVPLIVNGWTSKYGNFPWQATLFNLEEGNWTFTCGGSLISEKVVVTAAHCTWDVSKDVIRVGLGKYYSDYYRNERGAQIREVSKIIRHPLYQDYIGNYGSDIALLLLNESIEFSQIIKPVCIDWTLDDISSHLTANKLGMIAGMGVTENNTFSTNLRMTHLPIVSDKECIEQQSRDFKKYVTFTSFCAGWKNGTGVCNGDSGGGLVLPLQKDPTKWSLQGIVSVSPRRAGTSFCDPHYFTVFTKVGMYVKWIFKVLLDVHDDMMHDPFEGNNVVL